MRQPDLYVYTSTGFGAAKSLYSLAILVTGTAYHSRDVLLNRLSAEQCLHEFDAGLFYVGAGTGNAVQDALPAAYITLHDAVSYVMFPPLDLSGSCGSGKQLRIMLSFYVPSEAALEGNLAASGLRLSEVGAFGFRAQSTHQSRRDVKSKAAEGAVRWECREIRWTSQAHPKRDAAGACALAYRIHAYLNAA